MKLSAITPEIKSGISIDASSGIEQLCTFTQIFAATVTPFWNTAVVPPALASTVSYEWPMPASQQEQLDRTFKWCNETKATDTQKCVQSSYTHCNEDLRIPPRSSPADECTERFFSTLIHIVPVDPETSLIRGFPTEETEDGCLKGAECQLIASVDPLQSDKLMEYCKDMFSSPLTKCFQKTQFIKC